jgi:hypothetical protein
MLVCGLYVQERKERVAGESEVMTINVKNGCAATKGEGEREEEEWRTRTIEVCLNHAE